MILMKGLFQTIVQYQAEEVERVRESQSQRQNQRDERYDAKQKTFPFSYIR
jgi:hypothetical protein